MKNNRVNDLIKIIYYEEITAFQPINACYFWNVSSRLIEDVSNYSKCITLSLKRKKTTRTQGIYTDTTNRLDKMIDLFCRFCGLSLYEQILQFTHQELDVINCYLYRSVFLST